MPLGSLSPRSQRHAVTLSASRPASLSPAQHGVCLSSGWLRENEGLFLVGCSFLPKVLWLSSLWPIQASGSRADV